MKDTIKLIDITKRYFQHLKLITVQYPELLKIKKNRANTIKKQRKRTKDVNMHLEKKLQKSTNVSKSLFITKIHAQTIMSFYTYWKFG